MSEWKISPTDGLPYDPKADPKCKTCGGHGVVDSGCNYGCILESCPTCCAAQPKPADAGKEKSK